MEWAGVHLYIGIRIAGNKIGSGFHLLQPKIQGFLYIVTCSDHYPFTIPRLL